MRLEKLKLAGFKSFVDPTTVVFPSNMVGVVGPNGCGKSNIIDAVRWVMGESSAKHLRGESMSDVIFNGSANRQPVGQASVELVFDNSEDKIVGEYAQYNTIAIKRSVDREGNSNYYLNNTKCRRKDITNIFLGTGLGPRSYSIIEQGMVSRLIEAKPEELRIFLEEAAGISKYKERRRETENRMRHTRENLERLNDIIEELNKQLEKLQRQAKSAEKYKELKIQEATYSSQLQALRWQAYQQQLQNQQQLITDLELQHEACITEQTRLDTDIEASRQQRTAANDEYNEIQGRYYQIGSDIARLEQAIQHHRERKQQIEQDIAETKADLNATLEHQQADQQQLQEIEQQLTHITPAEEQAQSQFDAAQETVQDAEQQQAQWQTEWDAFNQQAAESSKLAHVEQTKIQHLEDQIQQKSKRLQQLQQEQQDQAIEKIQIELDAIQQEQQQQQAQATELSEKYQQINQQLEHVKQARAATQKQLDQEKQTLQTLIGKKASLTALQEAALGQDDQQSKQWLAHSGLADAPRYASQLSVDSGWETAVETVLGDYLQAVCVSQLDHVLDKLDDQLQSSMTFISDNSQAPLDNHKVTTTLLEKIAQPPATCRSLLSGVYIADDLLVAKALLPSLNEQESIITQQGIWISKHWCRVCKLDDVSSGVLARENQLKQLSEQLDQQTQSVEQLETTIESHSERVQGLENDKEQQQQAIATVKEGISRLEAKAQVKSAQITQQQKRKAQITDELTQIETQLTELQQTLSSSRSQWQNAMSAMETDTQKREHMQSSREIINQQLDSARNAAKQLRDRLHQLSLERQSYQTQQSSLSNSLQRLSDRIDSLKQRIAGLESALNQNDNPDSDLQAELTEKLQQHAQVSQQVDNKREILENIEQQLQQFDQARHESERKAREVHGLMDQHRLDAQSNKVRLSTIEEALAELELNVNQLIEQLPEQANETEWDNELQTIQQRISRLGPINLAAIEEYDTESERKNYLDTQQQDLLEALTTLEDAIRKIDKETRTRFKETYEQVNESFQQLFPKLFGGGQAYLELTGEDLLDTGVAVMARPPGKRNSSIHLLSGGEKALTAVAMVFSIFQLNPSPFCLLDEVDAPLDDANTLRYATLVKEMSSKTQFIFITHNKITMEQAEHLSGVTMHEPGVSRIVSVDVDQAAALAEE